MKDNQKIEIEIPIRGTFGLCARKVVYERTPQIEAAAATYVDGIIKYQDSACLSGDGYAKSFHWNRLNLYDAIAASNPELGKDRRKLDYIADTESFEAASKAQQTNEFVSANEVVRKNHPFHQLPKRVRATTHITLT